MHGCQRFVLALVGLALIAAALALPACGSGGSPADGGSVSPAPGLRTLRDQPDRLSIAYDPARLSAHVSHDQSGRAVIELRVRGSGPKPDSLMILPLMNASPMSAAAIDDVIRGEVSLPDSPRSETKLNGVRGTVISHTPAHGLHAALYDLYTPHGLYTVTVTASAKTAPSSWPLLTSTLSGLRISP